MAVSGDPPASTVLTRLDGALGEMGRREHRFAWLTDRSGGWLSVDAYYPSNRVVVLACEDPELLAVCEARVPAHGLYLLTLDPSDLADDRDVTALLRARLSAQGWVAPAARGGQEAPPPPPVAAVGAAEDGSASVAWSGRAGRSGAAGRRPRRQHGDPSAGVILVLIVVLELVVGGGVIGLGDSQYILGFGFLLDACARLLGTIAASQNGSPDAAWAIVLFGSPALWSRNDFDGELAPVAQVTAILAGFAVAVGLVVAIL